MNIKEVKKVDRYLITSYVSNHACILHICFAVIAGKRGGEGKKGKRERTGVAMLGGRGRWEEGATLRVVTFFLDLFGFGFDQSVRVCCCCCQSRRLRSISRVGRT